MTIGLVRTEEDFHALLDMARRHPAPEYDCTFDTYANVLRLLRRKPWVRMWLARDRSKPAGYLIAALDMSMLVDQVNVVDIYIEEEYRGSGLLIDLLNHLGDWAFRQAKVKRVRYTSRWPKWAWAKVCSGMRYKLSIDEYKTYVVEEVV